MRQWRQQQAFALTTGLSCLDVYAIQDVVEKRSESRNVVENGYEEWNDADCKLHRDGDQPAMVWPDGSKFWYRDGKLHRDGDQPAMVFADGSKIWFRDGKRHRDGEQPAVVWPDGSKFWYRDDKLVVCSLTTPN